MIRTVAVICWPYHLHRWPSFMSLQYYGIAFLMRGVTELQDLLGVIADWHLASRGQFQHTICALHIYVWTIWIWCRAFAINSSYHSACQKIETVMNVIKTSYQTNCLVYYNAWEIYWNLCPSFLKGLQGSEKTSAGLSQLWQSINCVRRIR
jgi:hypothetical protein